MRLTDELDGKKLWSPGARLRRQSWEDEDAFIECAMMGYFNSASNSFCDSMPIVDYFAADWEPHPTCNQRNKQRRFQSGRQIFEHYGVKGYATEPTLEDRVKVHVGELVDKIMALIEPKDEVSELAEDEG